MKIGILEAGLLNQKIADRFDPYPLMFERFLGKANRDLEFQAFSVVRSEMPASIYDCDGWLITGSRHGVYENLEWMLQLQDFIRELAAFNNLALRLEQSGTLDFTLWLGAMIIIVGTFFNAMAAMQFKAALVVPKDDKSKTILLGRYQKHPENIQIIQPKDVVQELIKSILRLKRTLDTIVITVSAATSGFSLRPGCWPVLSMLHASSRSAMCSRKTAAPIW